MLEQVQLFFEGVNSLIFLGQHTDFLRPVIVKVLKKEQATLPEILRFNNEYAFTRDLRIAGVRQAYRQTRYQHQPALLLEYIPGQTLKQRLQQGLLPLAEALALALQLSQTLGGLHQLGLIHRDINPTNMLLEAGSGRVWLIDFGLATRWDLKVGYAQPPQQLEGTLAYLSPEQTGRMNRIVDYRSDLYSLGVSLYELLTGELPFQAEDSIGWVHAHIAREPVPPHVRRPGLPPMLSRIVLKLMAKNAEDRYQSAHGLTHDLQRVAAGDGDFDLAGEDYSGRLQLPQKLYGRAQPLERLQAALARVGTASACELMLIAGYSGVGKTALVHQLHRTLLERRGYFVAGKFDQFQRHVPYSAFTQAFNQLCDQLLTESETELEQWRQRILAGVGHNGQVLIDLIPRLESLIGPQPEVPSLAPKEAQNRFNHYFSAFVQAICSRGRPLVMFVDDLQWADLASLELLKRLFTELGRPQGFLLIGAYRDNEVDAHHPFRQTLTELQAQQIPCEEIALGPLSQDDLAEWLADALLHPPNLEPLLELVSRKTLGNAFFVSQFLQRLAAERLLCFDFSSRRWVWDMARIEAQAITANVVTFLSDKISRLADGIQTVLRRAACIGNSFDLGTLVAIAERPAQETALALQTALLEGLLMPQGEVHQLRLLLTETAYTASGERYRFVHDRIQQAAYALIPVEARSRLHLRIGERLREGLERGDFSEEDCLFATVEHLHAGLDLVSDPGRRLDIARLSLRAGQRAKQSAAYEAAFRYLQQGLTGLPDTCWQEHYALSFELHAQAIEAAYVIGDFAAMEGWSRAALDASADLLDSVRIHELSIARYHAEYRLEAAVMTGLDVLDMLGIHLPRNPDMAALADLLAEARARTGARTPAELGELPQMQNAFMAAAVRVMHSINLSAFFFRPLLYPVLVCKAIALIAGFGNVPESAFVYATYGMILAGVFRDIGLAYAFGQVSRRQLGLPMSRLVEGRTLLVLGNGVQHWKEPILGYLPQYVRSFQACLEHGDLEFAAQAASSISFMGLFAGAPLEPLEREMAAYLPVIANLKVSTTLQYARIYFEYARRLYTPPAAGEARHVLKGEIYDETEMLPVHVAAQDYTAICVLYFTKQMLAYLFGDFPQALEYSEKARETLESILCVTHIVSFHAYDSLSRLALWPADDPDAQAAVLERVAANQALQKLWAEHGPANYAQKYLLVEAETARVLGQSDRAIAAYEAAIDAAGDGQHLQDAALIHECCGRYWLERGFERLARPYLREALRLYRLWGASEKAAHFEARYAPWLTPELAELGHSSPQPGSLESRYDAAESDLDYASLLKSTRAISQEISLDALLLRLLSIILENAGAASGCLLLPGESELLIEALRFGDAPPQILRHLPLSSQPQLPAALIQYVQRSGETLVLADAAVDERFAGEAGGIRSLLCLPFAYQGKLALVLYLEHRQLAGVFTPERLALLQLLLSQAVVSLENARIYDSLEAEVRHRTHELLEAKDAAEKANLAKSVFFANLNHEIRTPLNAIIGFSRLVVREPELRREQREKLDIVVRSGEHLLALINDTLEMARIEAGKIQVQPADFEPGLLLSEVEDILRPRARDKGLSLKLAGADTLPRAIRGDESKLRQVLLNLLGNAIKYTRSGSVGLQISCRPDPRRPARLWLRCAIRDTGIGIAAQDLEAVFAPFVQLETGSLAQGGFGLGLSISRRFIELMGGSLNVESTPGVGSEFRFELPVEAAVSGIQGFRQMATLAPDQPLYRILVVDNDAAHRSLMAHYLEPLGMALRQAGQGPAALELWQSWQPDLIFMDLRMPQMDGFEVARRIRAAGERPWLIAVTASAFEEDREQALSQGFDAFLRKPITEAEVQGMLARYLGLDFIYLERPAALADPLSVAELRPQLGRIPEPLRQRLMRATEMADIYDTEAAIQQMQPHAPELSAYLGELAQRFEYHTILALLAELPA